MLSHTEINVYARLLNFVNTHQVGAKPLKSRHLPVKIVDLPVGYKIGRAELVIDAVSET